VQNKTFVLSISGTALSVYGKHDFTENQYELEAFAPFSITILGFGNEPIVLSFDDTLSDTLVQFKYRIGIGYFALSVQG
jgi:hypothetical protein